MSNDTNRFFITFALVASVVVWHQTPALAQGLMISASLDAVAEPETGAVWIQKPRLFGGAIAGEWAENGRYTSHSGYFSRFNYRTAREGQFGQIIESNAGNFNGAFGVISGRGLYRRTLDGDWAVTDFFDSVSFSGCKESPDSPPCALFTAGTDSRGFPFVTYFDVNAAVVTEFWKNGAYRPSVGAESSLPFNLVDSAMWLSAETAIVRDFDADIKESRVPYISHGPQAINHHVPKYASPPSVSSVDYFLRAKSLMALGSGNTPEQSDGQPGYRAHLELFHVEDPLAAEPVLKTVGRLTAIQVKTSLAAIEADETVGYVSDGALVRGLRLADGKDVGTVTDCGKEPAVGLKSSAFDQSSIWIACADEILQLQNGAVIQRIALDRTSVNKGKIVGGKILSQSPGALDAVVFFEDSYAARVRSGQPTLTLRYSPLESVPSGLAFSWLEHSRLCGVFISFRAGGAQRTLRCRGVDGWQDADLGIGTPEDVRNIGNAWWAISTDNSGDENQVRIFRRAYGQQNWERVGEFSMNSGSRARFVPDAQGRAVVDIGDGDLLVWSDSKFDRLYSRKLKFGQPPMLAIDGQGILFSTCDAPNAGGIEFCAVSQDGRFQKVPMPPLTALPGAAHPLLKGIVLGTKVIRSTGSIEIDRLFGEFKAPIGFQLRVKAQPVIGGKVLLQAVFETETRMKEAKPYFFDGISLTAQSVTPPRYVKFERFSGGVSIGDSSSSFELSKPTYLSEDGVWRTPGSKSEVGLSPIDAWKRSNAPIPNFANDAVQVAGVTFIGTDDGLWRCPSKNGTMLSSATASLPTTTGCLRLVALPFVTKLVSVRARENEAWRLVVMQGRRLLHVTQSLGGEIAVTPINTPHVEGLSQEGSRVSWFTDRELITWDTMNDSYIRAVLPESKLVKSANERWVCTDRGLFMSANLGAWLQTNQKCLQQTVIGGEAYVIEERGLFRCGGENQGAPKCEFLAPLPKPYLADSTRLGTLASPSPSTGPAAVGLAMGTTVYSWDGESKRFVDVTPRGKNGSLLLTRVMELNAGSLSLDGGGVFVLPAAGSSGGQAQHFRIE